MLQFRNRTPVPNPPTLATALIGSRTPLSLSRLLAAAGTRRGLLALVLALLGSLTASVRHDAVAIDHPHHPAHRVRQRKHHHRRKRDHAQQLDEQEQRQDDRDERQDDKDEQDEQDDEKGGGLGSTSPELCFSQLRRAQCHFFNLENRWSCPIPANLAFRILMDCDLHGVDLHSANLHRADLTNANLTGANLSGADLTGVDWDVDFCPDGTTGDNNRSCCGHLNGAVPAAGC